MIPYLSGMSSLSYVVSKMSQHFVTGTNVSVVRISQIAAQKCQRQRMATELIAGTSQMRFISLYAHGSKQLRSSMTG